VNFDVQTYNDYSNGRNEGRTQVGVGVSKQLFNERLSVQVGGNVDVEGSEASRNTASDIAGDVIVEYKMSPDGTYRLKGFRSNQYEGLIEGQIIETGAGIIYVRDFETWKNLFRKKTPVFNNNERALNNK
jgi:translocation and assembly module TamB